MLFIGFWNQMWTTSTNEKTDLIIKRSIGDRIPLI